jgi:vacuolar-type H+-ATPase subunit E/Vma4
LINQAESDIKKINQQSLFQIAEAKKKNKERAKESSLKMKAQFNETYSKLLNSSLSSTLLKIKEEVLKSKNKLMLELISDLTELIKNKIKKNYKEYTQFILKTLDTIKYIIDKPPEITITFNSRDHEFFNSNIELLTKIFKNKLKIKKSEVEFTGGFVCVVSTGNISYNYTIENQLKKNTSIIEIEFSKIFLDSESDIKTLENVYAQFIQSQKLAVDDYLKDYE